MNTRERLDLIPDIYMLGSSNRECSLLHPTELQSATYSSVTQPSEILSISHCPPPYIKLLLLKGTKKTCINDGKT